ncbi:MAG: malonic semialdehyde reductase [Candidatus Thioglobus sp.]|nr:malonic semialdehyde reductase [Candidatus Thioglobus sp.]
MLSTSSLDKLFTKARSHKSWINKDITEQQINQIYDLLKFAPTSSNTCPARFTFIRSKEAKERLKPSLDEGNINQAMNSPAVVVISYDTEFYQKLPYLSPHNNAKSWYEGKDKKIKSSAEFNSALQGAYFIMATRSLGLDCCPMLGFNKEELNQEFFPDNKYKAIFICGIGYGDESNLHSRAPRLDFTEACKIL